MSKPQAISRSPEDVERSPQTAFGSTPDANWTELRKQNSGLGDAAAMIFELGEGEEDTHSFLTTEFCRPCSPGPKKEEVSNDDSAQIKDYMMGAAAASAMTGVTKKHGGPFGACIVRDGIFISVAHNTVLKDCDPTCHAEMNAIRYACKMLQSHDLSECSLFSTCEPCPMCWGAIQWSRLKKVHTGVDRFTAAKFGFDDKVFYDELAAQSGHHAIKLGKTMPNIDPAMLEVSMMGQSSCSQVQALLEDMQVNLTFRRRAGCETVGFRDDGQRFSNKQEGDHQIVSVENAEHAKYIQILEGAVRKAVKMGINKEREVFASCVVKDGKMISIAVNEVLKRRDATATSEVLAIRKAADRLQTYVLSGCTMYTTMEPDVMSLGAILWARIDKLYYGLSQKQAAKYGFEEGLLQYRELFADPDLVHNLLQVEEKVGFTACENVFKAWLNCNAIVY